MDRYRMDRQSFVAIVGGGAVLDMAGHAAAIAHRGLRVIRLPTTVLSQGDSGVGVKNAINAFGKKNFVGTFWPPFAVINDARFLETLGRRDILAGMAEAVKVALIRDRTFFQWLRREAASLAACEPAQVAELVRRCAELHLSHIATSGDPFEMGSARPLDFGHWALTSSSRSPSTACATARPSRSAWPSTRSTPPRTALPRETADIVLGTLDRIGLPLWTRVSTNGRADGTARILEGLQEFREHLGGELSLTMLRDIGEAVEVHEVDEPRLLRCLDALRARAERAGAA